MNRIYIALFLCLFTCVAWADPGRYASQSALSEGRWVKIRVPETGIYKLTYAELRRMGFSDPAGVSIHGYGGWILNEDFSKSDYIDDLPAVAVWRGNDYLLFYGKGPVKWSYVTDNRQFVHENNPYSQYGYYFITDATGTNDMSTRPSADGASLQIETFDDYQVYEKDEISIKNSGRELYGESFETRTTFTPSQAFSIPGITEDEGLVSVRLMAGGNGNVSVSVDDRQLLNNEYVTGSFNDIYTRGVPFFRALTWSGPKNETPGVSISYSPAGHTTYLDYIRLQVKRRLQSYGEAYTFFRSLASRRNVSRFNIRNATSDMLVFDVTDGINPVRMETTFGESVLSFTIASDTVLREFVLVNPSGTFPAPEQVNVVTHQNLHGLPQTEMVILAPPAFVGEAERLATHHRTHTQLSVTVVTPEQVYNEFSSGTPDATAIRRFMKMFYYRRSSDYDAPRFLLLFGDGSYDNRQLTQTWRNISMDNFIITYQTVNSHDAGSCVIEDYFGMLSDSNDIDIYKLDIHLGIGRFPVRTVAQARAAVDKVINYALNRDAGSWKNQLCFVADDGNSTDIFTNEHMRQSNDLARYIEQSHPAFLSNKQFFDAYRKSSVGGQMGYPDIEANIVRQLREGAFVINYTGHGNSSSWSDEHVITSTQIQQYSYRHLPLWITATCDFTPFDDFLSSAGEYVFLNERSGGIALFTTTRVAYRDSNFELNMHLLKNLFGKKSNGKRFTLGETIKETKRAYSGEHKIRFALIGDPALTLSFPEYELKITEINGQPVGEDTIQFKALERITIKGEVYDGSGNRATDFNGSFSATIMDSQETVTTLDNNSMGRTFEYQDYRSSLQRVNEEVSDGAFSFSFVVPSFISYSGLAGKISMYALDETTYTEANGAFKNFTVGGTSTNPESDREGPEFRGVYLNDTTFMDGDKVNDTPFLIARLWDQSGVYIGGSSLGHDMTLTIDNDPSYSYNLNSYYQTLSGGNEGLVSFPVPTLPAGLHTATLRVFDVLANSSTYTFTFEVVEGLKPVLADLRAAPSPARESVTFMLTHNRPESDMEITIRVYNLTGQLEWEYRETGSSEAFRSYNIPWDLTNGNGSRLRPGVYIYRAGIRTADSSEATKAKKLIILGQ